MRLSLLQTVVSIEVNSLEEIETMEEVKSGNNLGYISVPYLLEGDFFSFVRHRSTAGFGD